MIAPFQYDIIVLLVLVALLGLIRGLSSRRTYWNFKFSEWTGFGVFLVAIVVLIDKLVRMFN